MKSASEYRHLERRIRNLEQRLKEREDTDTEESSSEDEEEEEEHMGFTGFSDDTPFSRVKAPPSSSTAAAICKRCDFNRIGIGRRTLCDYCAENPRGASASVAAKSSTKDPGSSRKQERPKCSKCNWRYVGEGRRTQCDHCAENPKGSSGSKGTASSVSAKSTKESGSSRPKCSKCNWRYVGEGRRTQCDYCAENRKGDAPATKTKESGSSQKDRPKCKRCEHRYVGAGRRTLCDHCAEHPTSASSSRKTESANTSRKNASEGSAKKERAKCNKCNSRYVGAGRRTLCDTCAR